MKLIKFLAGVIFTLILFNITIANFSLDDSAIVADLTHDINSLKHANTILCSQIASKGSLTSAMGKIQAQGYTLPDQVVTLGQTSSLALR